MTFVQSIALKLRRAETPRLARVKNVIRSAAHWNLWLPSLVVWIYRAWHGIVRTVVEASRRVVSIVYREPLFRSWCAVAGTGLYLEQIPRVRGNVRFEIGHNVTISGDLVIFGARTFDEPTVIIGDRVFLGHRLTLQVAQRIVIEEGAAISPECFIADHDGHPSDVRQRIAGLPTPADEVQPVRIGRHAWIGRGSSILKGVTVGEGAVVGVHSVVVADIPPFTVAIGNPARVVRRLASEGI